MSAARRPTACQRSIRYFDSIAQEYSGKYAEHSPGGYALRVRKARLMEQVAGVAGRTALDVGCGPGVMVWDFLKLGWTYWGVDWSPQMIVECKRTFGRLSGANFSVGNAAALPFADEAFDLVVCMGVIDRVQRPETAIREMGRVLTPGGTLLISFPNLLSPYALWRSHVFYPIVGHLKQIISIIGRSPSRPDLASAATLWTTGTSSRTVEQVMGEVREIVYYNFAALLSPLEELFPTIALRFAERLERFREGRLRWLGAGFILRARKRM